jgi:HAD superfamily hydrolase (TIGR01450 family)
VPDAPEPLLAGSPQPLAERYDVALLDLDGVVYVGPAAVPNASESLRAASDLGMRLAYVTNNASRPPDVVAAHLRSIGIPAETRDVVTSAMAAARVVADLVPAGSPVLVVGGEGLRAALVERGLQPVWRETDDPVAVVQGFAPEVGWQLLAEGAYALQRGLPWVASNTDLTIPTPRGKAPGNGTLVQVLRLATARDPVVAGKPEPPMHREAMLRTGADHPLVVGDRLDTDIAAADRAGVASLLVLTGVTHLPELLAARPGMRPTYLGHDLRALLLPQPSVTADGEWWRCRATRARVVAGRLEVAGPDGQLRGPDDDGLDAVRACCAAVWAGRVPVVDMPAAVVAAVEGGA